MVKASAAAAVVTHLGKRRDLIHMATASISYVFQMQHRGSEQVSARDRLPNHMGSLTLSTLSLMSAPA